GLQAVRSAAPVGEIAGGGANLQARALDVAIEGGAVVHAVVVQVDVGRAVVERGPLVRLDGDAVGGVAPHDFGRPAIAQDGGVLTRDRVTALFLRRERRALGREERRPVVV